MKTILVLGLALITQVANATNVKVEMLFNENMGVVKSSQIHFSKIDGLSVSGECLVTSDNKSKCTFQRSGVDTYNGLNVLIGLSELNDEFKSFDEHGSISTIIDGQLYDQRIFKLDMKSRKGSTAEVIGLGILNINY